mmetsp:Transcript_66474/g.118206  ORF Transcript_66474/g.118206 Transcript_66474/m.118206 type:complete len:202 (+) Transcript_66474:610-1215(+)
MPRTSRPSPAAERASPRGVGPLAGELCGDIGCDTPNSGRAVSEFRGYSRPRISPVRAGPSPPALAGPDCSSSCGTERGGVFSHCKCGPCWSWRGASSCCDTWNPAPAKRAAAPDNGGCLTGPSRRKAHGASVSVELPTGISLEEPPSSSAACRALPGSVALVDALPPPPAEPNPAEPFGMEEGIACSLPCPCWSAMRSATV